MCAGEEYEELPTRRPDIRDDVSPGKFIKHNIICVSVMKGLPSTLVLLWIVDSVITGFQ